MSVNTHMIFILFLFYITTKVSPPSSSLSPLPILPLFPSIHSSPVSLQKRAVLPWISAGHGITSYSETRYLLFY